MYDLKGKSIKLRLVNENDAEFILSLRTDSNYNKYLSKVCNDIEQQKYWIRQYKDEETLNLQYYFIIERHDGTKCGTVRIYDIRGDSFSWGSWILNENKTRYAAIESALLIYKFGFEIKSFLKSHFEVLKGNDRVVAFHKKIGAYEIGSDNDHFYYEITPLCIASVKEKFSKYLE